MLRLEIVNGTLCCKQSTKYLYTIKHTPFQTSKHAFAAFCFRLKIKYHRFDYYLLTVPEHTRFLFDDCTVTTQSADSPDKTLFSIVDHKN